jgi:hypothetical protein
MWAVLVSLLGWIHIIGVLRKDQALGFGDNFFYAPAVGVPQYVDQSFIRRVRSVRAS